MKKLTLIVILLLALTGCAVNKPTDPAKVPARPLPEATYDGLSCQRLAAELNGLYAKEAQWIKAQEDRRRDSLTMEILLGVGRGDGREYEGLAETRGHISAVQSVMARKGCAQ
ncbi:MAG: hypothetical protein LBP33_01265 [Candidatus Adiutrix sp.]|jgi:hypothetical protein|nr:hypothetical protein [Candidatus Adiutrix sp.]